MSHLARSLSTFLALLLTGAPAVLAQSSPSPLPGVFTEVLDVRVVNLEVVVTDKDGVPVRGLGPDNFILEVDGEEVAVDYFTEVRGGVAAEVPPSQEIAGIAEIPAVVPGSPVSTSYLVFIDELFSLPPDRDAVLEALEAELPRLGPEDRMAIVAFNGRDLEMLSTWTNSVPALTRVLKKARERPTHGIQRLAEQRQYNFDRLLNVSTQLRAGQFDARAQTFFVNDLSPSERFYLDQLTEHVEMSVAAATATLRSFAQPPGRKVMMLYSGGWPYLPVSFLTSPFNWLILESGTVQGAELFQPLTDAANLLGYTLYPVDVPGFADRLAEATVSNAAEFSRADFGAIPQVAVADSVFQRRQELHYSLHFLADETGGEAFIDARRLAAFEGAVADTRSYYWLGFTPTRGWDNQRHDIDVQVRTPGFKVRSRAGFLDSSRERDVTMAVESTLLFGSPPGHGNLQVAMGQPSKAGRKKMQVPLTVVIPLDEVIFLPVENGQVAELELRVAVRDDQGRGAEIPVVPLVIQADSPPKKGAVSRFETSLKLRRYPHRAVVAIYDRASGRILSATTEISPETPPK
ncbi:MAG: VWA domain-containing protein [Thermoanaerobaculia bacterium]